MRRAVCPGSFDPVTNGHLDIVQRASGLFDEVIVAVGVNVSKSRLFTRRGTPGDAGAGVAGLANVRVEGFTGLITTYCREADAVAIVKGLRSGTDFDYELQMAQMNAHLTGVETVFVPADPQYGFVSSSLVKEVASYGGDVSGLVPDFVLGPLTERLAQRKARVADRPGPSFGRCRVRPAYDSRLDLFARIPEVTLNSLDPRAPLVLDTRELGRRPGSQREVSLTVPAPADLGIEVLQVPEGSPVELDLRLEAVMEGVLVTGTAHASLAGECARCLEPISDDIEVRFQELFVYEDHALPEEDDEVSMLQGDLVDLEPLLRDAVVLALPFQPLCMDDCPGLCPECGARLADDPDHAHEAAIDPRWAALADLTQTSQTTQQTEQN